MKLATADEMRRIDAATIEKYSIPGVVLMENAGRHVARAVREMLDDQPDARVVVICGKGNNGGDGFVVARHLINQGVNIQVILLANGTDLGGDAAMNFRIAHNMGVPILENADEEAVRARVARADIIVDAILGIGIVGEVRGIARAAIEAINNCPARVIAADIPSGISADTGAVAGEAVLADVTVTFGLAKLGLVQHPGAEYCGELRVADITIPRGLLVSESLKANLVTAEMAQAMLPARQPAMHKGDAGRVLVVAGSVGMTGAAALCGLGALRAGAGLVTVACPQSLNDILEAKCTEVMTAPLPETSDRTISQAAQSEVLEHAGRCDAVAFGPGLSQNPDTAAFVRETIRAIPAPLVLDADGLNCLDGDASALTGRSAPTIITPHPGELARLVGSTIENIQEDRVDAARRAAEATNSVVVLKGAASVIADPEGEVWINSTGNSGMASGGMGDVLTGMIAAFLAGSRGSVSPLTLGPAAAAVAGVYYHGLAADLAAEDGGRSLIATDALGALHRALPD